MRVLIAIVLIAALVVGYIRAKERLDQWHNQVNALIQDDQRVMEPVPDIAMRAAGLTRQQAVGFLVSELNGKLSTHREICKKLIGLFHEKPLGLPLNAKEQGLLSAYEGMLRIVQASNATPAITTRPRTPTPQDNAAEIARKYGSH